MLDEATCAKLARQLDDARRARREIEPLHKTFGPFFRPTTPDAYKQISRENLGKRFDWLDKQLAGKDYLMGKQFTVADAYLFVLTNWTKPTQIDLAKWPNIQAFNKRVAGRAKVKEAMQFEGLLPKEAERAA